MAAWLERSWVSELVQRDGFISLIPCAGAHIAWIADEAIRFAKTIGPLSIDFNGLCVPVTRYDTPATVWDAYEALKKDEIRKTERLNQSEVAGTISR